MAYFVSTIQSQADGGFLFGEAKKIRLSGGDGPIARYVCSLPDTAESSLGLGGGIPWDLPIAKIALEVIGGSGKAVIFWDDGEAIPSLVIRICGTSTRSETEILLHLELLESCGAGYRLTGKRTGEALRLTGGWGGTQARWAWAPPKMGIGSAMLGGSD